MWSQRRGALTVLLASSRYLTILWLRSERRVSTWTPPLVLSMTLLPNGHSHFGLFIDYSCLALILWVRNRGNFWRFHLSFGFPFSFLLFRYLFLCFFYGVTVILSRLKDLTFKFLAKGFESFLCSFKLILKFIDEYSLFCPYRTKRLIYPVLLIEECPSTKLVVRIQAFRVI